jgi:valyl-tRNA synthetase
MAVFANLICQIMELAKSFEPADIEQFWRSEWEQRGYYRATLTPANLLSASSCRRRT